MKGPNKMQPTSFEGHVQMVLQALVILAVSWMGFLLTDTREKVVRLEERVTEMRTQVIGLNDNRYRATDAVRDLANRDAEVQRLERRVDALEKRMK